MEVKLKNIIFNDRFNDLYTVYNLKSVKYCLIDFPVKFNFLSNKCFFFDYLL